MSCVKLAVSKYDFPHVPDAYIENDDIIVLDVDDGFTIKLTRFIESEADINKIKIDGILGATLPSTPKNDIVLREYILPELVTGFETIPISIIIGGNKSLYSDIYVREWRNGEYDVEFRSIQNHWAYKAKNLKLKDLNFGAKVPFTQTTLFNRHQIGAYTDGTQGIQFPLVNYGKWSNPNGIKVDDFRPFFYLLYVLQLGFCHIGYKFRSPIFESDWGRRLICYLLAKDFGNDRDLLNSKNFFVQVDLKQNILLAYGGTFSNLTIHDDMTRALPFKNVIVDNGGNWGNVTYRYKGDGVHTLYAKIHYSLKWTAIYNNEFHFTTFIMFRNADGTVTEIDSKDTVVSINNGYQKNVQYEIYHEIIVDDFLIQNGASVFVKAKAFDYSGINGVTAAQLDINTDSVFYNTPKVVFFKEGDNIDLAQTIHPDLTLLDLTKAAIHLVNGKLDTNDVLRELWLYPTYNTRMHDGTTVVNGFFRDTTDIDLNDILIEDSEQIVNPDGQKQRYLQLKFKGDGDGYVKAQLKDGDKPLYSYTVDFGNEFEEGTETSENPLFEATAMELISGVTLPFAGQNTQARIALPCMGDDTSGEKLNYDIKPRILYWAGNKQQINDGKIVYYNQFNINTNLVPYAFSKSPTKQVPTSNGDYNENVVYGDLANKLDLYRLFWQRWLYETKESVSIELLLLLNNLHYFKFDFRDYYSANILGRSLLCRMVSIRDYDICSGIPTPITLIPVKSVSGLCIDIPTSEGNNPCDENRPEILITKNGSCYNFSLSGTSQSPIASVVFKWRYISSTNWTISSQVCNPTGAFEVQMIVDYSDSCPDIVRNAIVDACGNAPTVTWQYDYQNDCVTFITGGINTVPLASIIIEYSLDNGVTWLPYTLNSCTPMSANLVKWRATFNYMEGCPPILLEGEFTLPPDEPDCSQITADAECDSVGNITRIGLTIGNVALDIIEYRPIGGTDWKVWDNMTPIPCPFEFRRVLFFCNDQCPIYCSPVHTCNCTSCSGTSVTISETILPNFSHDLTANTISCPSPIYEWFKDGISLGLSTQTINVIMSGTYEVVVNCSNGCEVSDDIVVVYNCGLPLGDPIHSTTCNDD